MASVSTFQFQRWTYTSCFQVDFDRAFVGLKKGCSSLLVQPGGCGSFREHELVTGVFPTFKVLFHHFFNHFVLFAFDAKAIPTGTRETDSQQSNRSNGEEGGG